MEKDDLEEIKAKMKNLDEVMHRISSACISRLQAEGAQAGAADKPNSDEDMSGR